MIRLILAALLFMASHESLADEKNREKAKFDLISQIEVLVNIDECKKGIQEAGADASGLPRACSSLPYLSKYFFDQKKDKEAIDTYLANEESRVTEKALQIVTTFHFKKLGKMTLSDKCVKNRDPVDLDIYINKIRGVPVEAPEKQEDTAANPLDNGIKRSSKNELMPMPVEPRNPAGNDEHSDRHSKTIDDEFESGE